MTQHPLGSAAHQVTSDSRSSLGSNNNEISGNLLRFFDNLLIRNPYAHTCVTLSARRGDRFSQRVKAIKGPALRSRTIGLSSHVIWNLENVEERQVRIAGFRQSGGKVNRR